MGGGEKKRKKERKKEGRKQKKELGIIRITLNTGGPRNFLNVGPKCVS